jgi:glycosyltransferase involved in cell wall biosynthesis
MKVYTLQAGEKWICDRFVSEWNASNPDIISSTPEDASIIWLLADWCWNQIPREILARKRVVCTVHHIVPEKFSAKSRDEFLDRDQYVDLYHVPCENTRKQVQSLTSKPVFSKPFWVNQNIWFPTDRQKSRRMRGIPDDRFLVGSFQRDTEGSDLKSPKLEKGPDIFCDIVIEAHKRDPRVLPVLAGWRRHYVINRFKDAKIPYFYAELPGFDKLNEMYSWLDLYLVTSRYEGGPQAVLECAATMTPILSTNVGVSPEILSANDIISPHDNVDIVGRKTDVDHAFSNVKDLFMPTGLDVFRNTFKEI